MKTSQLLTRVETQRPLDFKTKVRSLCLQGRLSRLQLKRPTRPKRLWLSHRLSRLLEQTEAKLVQLGRDHENQIAKTRNEVQKELLDQKREEEVKSRESRCDNST